MKPHSVKKLPCYIQKSELNFLSRNVSTSICPDFPIYLSNMFYLCIKEGDIRIPGSYQNKDSWVDHSLYCFPLICGEQDVSIIDVKISAT